MTHRISSAKVRPIRDQPPHDLIFRQPHFTTARSGEMARGSTSGNPDRARHRSTDRRGALRRCRQQRGARQAGRPHRGCVRRRIDDTVATVALRFVAVPDPQWLGTTTQALLRIRCAPHLIDEVLHELRTVPESRAHLPPHRIVRHHRCRPLRVDGDTARVHRQPRRHDPRHRRTAVRADPPDDRRRAHRRARRRQAGCPRAGHARPRCPGHRRRRAQRR